MRIEENKYYPYQETYQYVGGMREKREVRSD